MSGKSSTFASDFERSVIVEKPIDFWLRKGKAVGETKPTESDRDIHETISNHYQARLTNAMAKIRLPPGCTFAEAASELKTIGVTLDAHPLPDGTYRAYVRKSNIQLFLSHLQL